MHCRNCGAEMANGLRFCSNCGAALSYERGTNYTPERLPKKKRKNHWFLKLLAFLLVVAAVLVGRFLYSLDLYVYSKMTIHGSNELTIQEQQEFESLFSGTYLYDADDDYHIVDLESGLEGLGADLLENNSDIVKFNITSQGNYAYIEIMDPNSSDKITYSFYKANLLEKLYFSSRYFSW